MLNLEKDNLLLSRFRLSEMIGQGGMGQVWRVWDQELEIQIAAKILNPQLMSDPHRVQLLKNECRNTRRLAHPNIVRVFDFHRSEDLAFISMEYVDGQNLNDYHRQKEPIGISQIIRLIKPVINALGYAHDMGLVHRDVKAGNILIDQQQAPRLTDFGIAGVFKSGPHALEITSGGSLFCMSPQQLDNRPPAPSDDIYALGVLLYQMITGYPPFYPDITRDRIRYEPPVAVNQRLRQLAVEAAIPDSMDTLIANMLAKAPADRPGSVREIEAFLNRTLPASIEPTQPPRSPAAGTTRQPPASDQTEMIAPVRVTSTKKRKRLTLNAHSNLIKGTTLLVTFIMLLAGGFWLWRYLAGQYRKPAAMQTPISEQRQPAPEKTAVAPERPPQTTSDPTRLAAEKVEAENKLAEFMQLKQALEAKSVSKWGAETYQSMSQFADEADQGLIEKQYGRAADAYAAAIARARELIDRIEPVLKQLLAEGQSAIEAGDGPLAEEKFSIALLIDPDSPMARDGLQRAKNTETVKRLLESGDRHETEGNLAAAHTDYQEAVRLDPASNKARQALARVDGQLRDRIYQQLMSDGLTAIHNKNYQLARTKLRRAKALRPQSREVNDALTQVDQSIRLGQIESYHQQAVVSEQSENWQQALSAYQQVLKIDPTLQFAVQGKQRAAKHIRIDKRLDFYLKQPAVLESDRQLENALELMAEIDAIESTGPRLQKQYKELARIVNAAQTPVKIILESDTFTDVAVYKVGKLGRFASRELNLRPGSYTVVGTRDGYQDVRKKIIVEPEQGPMRVTIRCEVKI